MRFVIVTGMSGAGKRTALKMLEDAGYYCVDNLPVSLLPKFTEIISMPGNEISKVALGIDVRADSSFEDATKCIQEMKDANHNIEILFMESSDATLIKRYKESRRIHPLSAQGHIEEGVTKERQVLATIRKNADYIIDTSNLLTRELKEELDRILVHDNKFQSLIVNVMSFGYKNGVPADADLMLDVRFLPNPFYVEELKYKTGNDREVQDYVMKFPQTHEFMDKLTQMLRFLLPNYIKEGKYRLVVAIGCTGGKHRSVTLANELYQRLKNEGYGVTIYHRDVNRQGL